MAAGLVRPPPTKDKIMIYEICMACVGEVPDYVGIHDEIRILGPEIWHDQNIGRCKCPNCEE